MNKNLTFLLINILIGTALTFDINKYEYLIKKIASDKYYQNEFNKQLAYLKSLDENYMNYKPTENFNCNTSIFSRNVPTSVHELQPSDIKVIGALGDSLTAGLGGKASTIIGLLVENREISWSIGGTKTVSNVISLPNILKKFNPDLYGYSTKSTLLHADHDKLNVAISGQEANHIPEQARNLIRLIKSSDNIDFENDWKLVTILIGGNDLCDSCNDLELHSPERYIQDIKEGLDILQTGLPRTFVNLVTIMQIKDLKEMNSGICGLLHKSECPCAAFPKDEKAEQQLQFYNKEYTRLAVELVDTGRYDNDQFTVVIQPFMRDFNPPRLDNGRVDLSYFAPDCFHFSAKSHALGSIALWNNMLQPVGKKATTWNLGEDIYCPTKQHPYIFTKKNSL